MIDFDELVRREASGQVVVGVDRPFARRFYTDLPVREIEAQTGEAPYFEKMVVYAAFIGGPLLLLVSLAESIWVLGWWSALFIPLAVIVWAVVYVNSPKARAGMTAISLIVVVSAIGFGVSNGSRPEWGLILTYVSALWLSLLLYVAATSFLRGFVLRNRRAYEWIQEHLIVREVG